MDIFAHGLWTNAAFYGKNGKGKTQRYAAVLFGILPDLLSFTPLFLFSVVTLHIGHFRNLPSYIWERSFALVSYNFTHSLVIFAAVMLLVLLLRKGKMYWPMWGWALHILIDIPSHRGFYETPFLFPLSSYRFEHGVTWAGPGFMLVNYSALAAVYLIWFFVFRKKYAGKK